MLKNVETSIGGSSLSSQEKEKAFDIITRFETRLEIICTNKDLPPARIAPLLPGSVIVNLFGPSQVFVAYQPMLGVPAVSYSHLYVKHPEIEQRLTAFGITAKSDIYDNLELSVEIYKEKFIEKKLPGEFFCVKLQRSWLSLPPDARDAKIDEECYRVIRIATMKAKSVMVPVKSIFGENIFPIQKGLVFVLMPFDQELTRIYNTIVRPQIEQLDLTCRRADDLKSNQAIMYDVWKSICEAEIIFADITGLNPNVMYELGIAHALGKETIIINQKNEASRLPFDIAHIRIIDYENTAVGSKDLEEKITATFHFVLGRIAGEIQSS